MKRTELFQRPLTFFGLAAQRWVLPIDRRVIGATFQMASAPCASRGSSINAIMV